MTNNIQPIKDDSKQCTIMTPWSSVRLEASESDHFDSLPTQIRIRNGTRGKYLGTSDLDSVVYGIGRRWGNWAKIPCFAPVCCTLSVCKKIAITSSLLRQARSYPDETFAFLSQTNQCPSGWVYLNTTCVFVSGLLDVTIRLPDQDVRQTYLHYSSGQLQLVDYNFQFFEKGILQKSRNACGKLKSGAQVATVDVHNPYSVNAYKNFLNIWTKELQYIPDHVSNSSSLKLGVVFTDLEQRCMFLTTKNGKHKMEHLTEITQCNHVTSKVPPVSPVAIAVLCEIETVPIDHEMKISQFRCRNGVYISVNDICDGVKDCESGIDEINCQCNKYTFKCGTGECISLNKVCNFKQDCTDNTDELSCQFRSCKLHEFRCHNHECIDNTKQCDFVKDCFDGSDEDYSHCHQNRNGFQCYDGKLIPFTDIDDLYPDCPSLSQEDENAHHVELAYHRGEQRLCGTRQERRVKITMARYCENMNYIRCSNNHLHCYPRSSRCIYDEDKYGYQPCKHLEHLHGCEDFQCPGKFKCPNTYCVPIRKVCVMCIVNRNTSSLPIDSFSRWRGKGPRLSGGNGRDVPIMSTAELVLIGNVFTRQGNLT